MTYTIEDYWAEQAQDAAIKSRGIEEFGLYGGRITRSGKLELSIGSSSMDEALAQVIDSLCQMHESFEVESYDSTYGTCWHMYSHGEYAGMATGSLGPFSGNSFSYYVGESEGGTAFYDAEYPEVESQVSSSDELGLIWISGKVAEEYSATMAEYMARYSA